MQNTNQDMFALLDIEVFLAGIALSLENDPQGR